jgi:hypothetical protein
MNDRAKVIHVETGRKIRETQLQGAVLEGLDHLVQSVANNIHQLMTEHAEGSPSSLVGEAWLRAPNGAVVLALKVEVRLPDKQGRARHQAVHGDVMGNA